MTQSQWIRRVARPAVFVLCLFPFAFLLWGFFTDTLSANPIDDITDETGTWTLRFLMITLTMTPLRKITGWNGFLQFRRMFGLFAFSYGVLHFTTYVWLDQFFNLGEIVTDVARRPFITVGFASFVLMIPLALTSNDRMTRWIGGRRWRILH
ncbi:MAG: protein-methionine-sulfoxide reductase heme-binding subunit MsrQ, partial [Bacteroidota bacterium]